jgi:hypothetical protein
MRVSWLGCVISALVVTTAFGQPAATQTATIPLTSGETLQDVQSILTTLADIGDVRQADTDSAKTAVVVTGTAEQIAFARWLVGELDKPATAPFPANSAEHEYNMQGTADDLVRVFYWAHCETQQNQQEVMTAIRTVENIRRLFPYPSRRALTVRGTAADIALAEWLVNELDWPVNAQSSPPPGPRQYQVPGGNEVVRVFYIPRLQNAQELESVYHAVRSATDARRMFPNSAHKALVVRGTVDQMATAERVISDRP